jgi:hypothetical protein
MANTKIEKIKKIMHTACVSGWARVLAWLGIKKKSRQFARTLLFDNFEEAYFFLAAFFLGAAFFAAFFLGAAFFATFFFGAAFFFAAFFAVAMFFLNLNG